MSTPLLSVRGVTKRFGTLQALHNVDLDFQPGEVHAVLGENGAGKSTLMNVLAGGLRPDHGTVLLHGAPVRFASPRDARQAGIGMVHQHFTLVDDLTVAENLALSMPQASSWRFRTAETATEATALAQRVGLDLSPPEARVSQLSVGARQRLEILKALASAGRVLILDEPTAVLTPQEVHQLFAMLRLLAAQGRLIVFITHKLREVKEIADRVTVMRRGQVISTCAAGEISEGEMAERMVGGTVPARQRVRTHAAPAPVALHLSNLNAYDSRGVPALQDLTLEVRAGEIFGIAGVDGNGQRELFNILVGLLTPASGTVRVGGAVLRAYTPRVALASGIAHIPPDRQHQGLVLGMTVRENLLLNRAVLDRFSWRGLLRRPAAAAFTEELARRYGVRRAALDAPVHHLSGGNQQKIVVARALAQRPTVLVTANPTRGLDVVAAAAVADALLETAATGCAVVLISADLDEVLDLSDRVSVLSRGRLSPAFEPSIGAEQLGLLMAGVSA